MKNLKNKSKKSIFRLPLHVYLLYLVLITSLLMGVTFSKYVTIGTESDYARAAHLGNIELYETDEEGNRLEGVSNYEIIPGVNLYKHPVLNYADKRTSEMSVYVFLTITTTGWAFDSTAGKYSIVVQEAVPQEPSPEPEPPSPEPPGPDPSPEPDPPPEPPVTIIDKEIMSWQPDTARWTYLTKEVLDGAADKFRTVYYIELPPGGSLTGENIISGSSIAVSPDLTENQMTEASAMAGNIEFEGCAVQLAGFGTPLEAWNAVKDK